MLLKHVCNFRNQKRLVGPAGFEEIFFQGCAFYLCCGFCFVFLFVLQIVNIFFMRSLHKGLRNVMI